MLKDDLNVHVFQYKNLCSPKSDRSFFFLTLVVRGPFHRKDFEWKKYGSTGLISEKAEVLYADLNERAEAVTSSYSVTGDSLRYIYSLPVTKNHRNIRSTLHKKWSFPIKISLVICGKLPIWSYLLK